MFGVSNVHTVGRAMASGPMIIWILFAVATTATTAAFMHPLSSGRLRPLKDGLDAHVYRDQLIELESEFTARQIAADEYELAKAEAARRLFKAVERPHVSGGSRLSHGWVRLAVAVFLPLFSIGLYVSLGSPSPARISRSLSRRHRPIWSATRRMAGDGTSLLPSCSKWVERTTRQRHIVPRFVSLGRASCVWKDCRRP